MLIRVAPDDEFLVKQSVSVLQKSFGTVALEFSLTRENNPSNPAFVNEKSFKDHLMKEVEFYLCYEEKRPAGCIAIERSPQDPTLFYIERVGVMPQFRHRKLGRKLMDLAFNKILELGGNRVSVGIIDQNVRLKNWYLGQGFYQTSVKKIDHLPFDVCFLERTLSKEDLISAD